MNIIAQENLILCINYCYRKVACFLQFLPKCYLSIDIRSATLCIPHTAALSGNFFEALRSTSTIALQSHPCATAPRRPLFFLLYLLLLNIHTNIILQ